MKSLKWILSVCAAVATVGVAFAVIQRNPRTTADRPAEQRFHVRGEVRGIDLEAKSIRIKHEEIPNYMAAMTMPFEVRDAGLLRGLKAGDEIGFELAVTETDSWIAGIQRLGESGPAPVELLRNDGNDIQRLQPGETVPDFELIDQNGQRVRLSTFRGKGVLLSFIYTRCPLPNFCPLMSKNFADLQERLQKSVPGRFELMSVSIDPEFDRPEILKQYAARYTADQSTWAFATGTTEQTDAVGALFGLVQERAGGLINHDLRTALVGPDGRLVHVWKSNVWTPYEVERRVDEAFGLQR